MITEKFGSPGLRTISVEPLPLAPAPVPHPMAFTAVRASPDDYIEQVRTGLEHMH